MRQDIGEPATGVEERTAKHESFVGAMSSLRTDDKLDHYRIEGVAARSGMASIFRTVERGDGRSDIYALGVMHL